MALPTIADQFRIKAISATEDEDCRTFMLGLAENTIGEEGSYILFQIPLDEMTDEDREMGIEDSYCLLSQHGGACYGGAERIEMTKDKLLMHLSEAATEDLGHEGRVLEMPLDVEDADRELMEAGLKRIFSHGDPKHHPVLTGF